MTFGRSALWGGGGEGASSCRRLFAAIVHHFWVPTAFHSVVNKRSLAEQASCH